MRPTSLDFLASAANARILGNASRNVFDVKIDSREAAAGCLFVCVIGDINDGHDYIHGAYDNGCRIFLMSREEKADYLKRLFTEVFIRDIIDRNRVQNDTQLESLLNVISSAVGSLTNPRKLEDTFASSGTGKLAASTIKQYLDYLCDAFVIERAERYDIKGKRYISTPYKYYFTDAGLRNARLNFRQLEETHLMENVVYNELCLRGYSVDVGVVEINERQEDGKYVRKQIEIDFVCNKADERVYVQSAFSIPTTEKRLQEERPLRNVGDGFRKVIVTKDNVIKHNDENGILIIGLQEFLMDDRALER